MKLLVVDGDPAARAAAVTCLRGAYPDAEIVATGDGMEAVQVSLNTPVDAVYTAVLMPRINGFDVARLVRKFRPGAAAYLVSETDEYVDGARERGLSGYYLKPLAGDALQMGNLLARGRGRHTGRESEIVRDNRVIGTRGIPLVPVGGPPRGERKREGHL